jgi:hypothetical protein
MLSNISKFFSYGTGIAEADKGLGFIRIATIVTLVLLILAIPFVLMYRPGRTSYLAQTASCLSIGASLQSDNAQCSRIVDGNTSIKLKDTGELVLVYSGVEKSLTNAPFGVATAPFTMSINEHGSLVISDGNKTALWRNVAVEDSTTYTACRLCVKNGGNVYLTKGKTVVHWVKDGEVQPFVDNGWTLPTSLRQGETMVSNANNKIRAGVFTLSMQPGGKLQMQRGSDVVFTWGPQLAQTSAEAWTLTLENDGSLAFQIGSEEWLWRNPKMSGSGPWALTLTETGFLDMMSSGVSMCTLFNGVREMSDMTGVPFKARSAAVTEVAPFSNPSSSTPSPSAPASSYARPPNPNQVAQAVIVKPQPPSPPMSPYDLAKDKVDYSDPAYTSPNRFSGFEAEVNALSGNDRTRLERYLQEMEVWDDDRWRAAEKDRATLEHPVPWQLAEKIARIRNRAAIELRKRQPPPPVKEPGPYFGLDKEEIWTADEVRNVTSKLDLADRVVVDRIGNDMRFFNADAWRAEMRDRPSMGDARLRAIAQQRNARSKLDRETAEADQLAIQKRNEEFQKQRQVQNDSMQRLRDYHATEEGKAATQAAQSARRRAGVAEMQQKVSMEADEQRRRNQEQERHEVLKEGRIRYGASADTMDFEDLAGKIRQAEWSESQHLKSNNNEPSSYMRLLAEKRRIRDDASLTDIQRVTQTSAAESAYSKEEDRKMQKNIQERAQAAVRDRDATPNIAKLKNLLGKKF